MVIGACWVAVSFIYPDPGKDCKHLYVDGKLVVGKHSIISCLFILFNLPIASNLIYLFAAPLCQLSDDCCSFGTVLFRNFVLCIFSMMSTSILTLGLLVLVWGFRWESNAVAVVYLTDAFVNLHCIHLTNTEWFRLLCCLGRRIDTRGTAGHLSVTA